MSSPSLALLLADAILILHAAFVAFVVLGLVAIYLGFLLNWRWVRNRRFRILHVLAIAVVALQSWLGLICPLTTWEMSLRAAAGDATYAGSFIQHWLHRLLYYRAPEWVFILLYSGVFSLVALGWYLVRPNRRMG
jgi:hypothetical protein